jgi:hypothetical protein
MFSCSCVLEMSALCVNVASLSGALRRLRNGFLFGGKIDRMIEQFCLRSLRPAHPHIRHFFSHCYGRCVEHESTCVCSSRRGLEPRRKLKI